MGNLYFCIEYIAKNRVSDMERFTSLKDNQVVILSLKPKLWRERNEIIRVTVYEFCPYRRNADRLRLHQSECRYDYADHDAAHDGEDDRAYHGAHPCVHRTNHHS